MLLAAQNLRGWSQDRPPLDDDENLFVGRSADIEKFFRGLCLQDVLAQTERYLTDAFGHDVCPSDFREQEHELMRIRAFLQEYLRFSHHSLLGISDWIKGVLKLAWIVCGLVYRLARDGLCKPSEAPESSCNVDAPGEPLEGTGMGSGSGEKDISNEIEDASQVEGLQSEEQPQSQRPNTADEKEDDALEMGEDFEGDLDDPHDTQEDKDESEDESGPELDEKIQDLENDAKAVDEKFWSGEKGPEDSAPDKDRDHDAPTNQSKDDADIVAKTDRETHPNEVNADSSRNPEDDRASEGEVPSEGMDDAEDLPEDSEQPNEGRKLDDMVQDAHTLDLPEDMNLDLDTDGGSDGGASHEEAMNVDDTPDYPDDVEETEMGETEPGNDAIPLEEKSGSTEPDATQEGGRMLSSTAEAGASNEAQDAKEGQRGGPADSISGHVGGSMGESKGISNEANEQSGESPDKEAQDDAQPMPQEEE